MKGTKNKSSWHSKRQRNSDRNTWSIRCHFFFKLLLSARMLLSFCLAPENVLKIRSVNQYGLEASYRSRMRRYRVLFSSFCSTIFQSPLIRISFSILSYSVFSDSSLLYSNVISFSNSHLPSDELFPSSIIK